MRRALIAVAVVAVCAAAAMLAGAGGESAAGKTYKIVFDNAFGLVDGADFKVGGVPVGSIESLDVRRSDDRAVATVGVAKNFGFGGLRSDATCRIAPQSLIGEYFIDCQPGTRGEPLHDGGTVDVRQTQSPIPADLVADVMRLPERQRFSIILGELGAGLAARGNDLNDTIKRSLPAIGATDRVLRILADNRRTLRSLAHDSGVVMKVLGARHHDVGRFITSAKDTAVASAERSAEIAETFRRFPGFLDELQPTMADLGTAARLQAPALADLRAAAPSLTSLLGTLRPFSGSLDTAVTSLGSASRSGRTAASESASLVKLLRTLGGRAPEVAKNAGFVASDLDDRGRAVEKDPRSPGGAGYTGFEAMLQYIFDQSLGANIYDQRGYALKIDLAADDCGAYTTAADAKANPERYKKCGQGLGPNQPGITTADPSPPATARSRSGARRQRGDGAPAAVEPVAQAPAQAEPQLTATPQPQLGIPRLPELTNPVQQLVDKLPPVLGPGQTTDLLDFLFGP